VQKTGRLVIVDEAPATCSAASEIAALVVEDPDTFRALTLRCGGCARRTVAPSRVVVRGRYDQGPARRRLTWSKTFDSGG